MGELIRPLEEKAARERMLAGKPSGKLPEGTNGRALDKTAEAVGMGRKTYEKAKAVIDAAATEPETYADLVEKMDATGKVDKLQRLRRRANGCN